MELHRGHEDALEALTLAAHDLEVTLIPALGGKISSLRWHGCEVLARNPRRPFRVARYGAPYAEFDASGWDECLPTIGPCPYPEPPWQGVETPDHGEVWSIPWRWALDGNVLRLETHGVRFPYTFVKSVEIVGPGAVGLRYALTNHAPLPFKYLWSAHPLILPRPGMRILLPEGVRVRVDWSKDERLGGLLAEHDWPHTRDRAGHPVDLGQILGPAAGLVDKLYTTRLSQGWCAVHDPADGYYVTMLFSPERVPYVGLSINMGGWPVEGPGYYNLGLEPCNGYPDRLDLAVERGDCAVAPPGATLEWALDVHIGQAADMGAEIDRLRRLGRR